MRDKMKFGGFYRLQITEPTKEGEVKVVGDSGWCKNMITNAGCQGFIVEKMTGGGSQVGYAALGATTNSIASTMTALPNEVAVAAGRFAVVGAVSVSRTLRFTGSLAANVLASTTIGAVGLFQTTVTNAGTMFAGNTFASSTLATNQAVNLTYDVQFPAA